MFRNFLTAFSAVLMWIIFSSAPASSEENLGRWCLEILPGFSASNNVVNIILTDSGSYEARWIFADASSFTYELRNVSPGVFSIVYFEDSSGDRLEILPGVLVVLDNTGMVAVGDKMAANEGREECMEK